MIKKEKIWLYLDDVRIPTEGNWEVVRNYDEFIFHIKMHGLENYEVISLDHDLGEGAMVEYYTNVKPNYELNYERIPEKTGMDCARFLVTEAMGKNIQLPTIYVHSANPIGSANIMGYINNYLMNCHLPQTCVRVKIDHTYSIEQTLTEEQLEKRYNILNKKIKNK